MQRLSINKSTGEVADVGQFMDPSAFDNADYPDNTIPPGTNPRHYKRLADLSIVKLTQQEIEAKFPTELRRRLRSEFQTAVAQLAADIQGLPAGPQKQMLADLLRIVRMIALLQRME